MLLRVGDPTSLEILGWNVEARVQKKKVLNSDTIGGYVGIFFSIHELQPSTTYFYFNPLHMASAVCSLMYSFDILIHQHMLSFP